MNGKYDGTIKWSSRINQLSFRHGKGRYTANQSERIKENESTIGLEWTREFRWRQWQNRLGRIGWISSIDLSAETMRSAGQPRGQRATVTVVLIREMVGSKWRSIRWRRRLHCWPLASSLKLLAQPSSSSCVCVLCVWMCVCVCVCECVCVCPHPSINPEEKKKEKRTLCFNPPKMTMTLHPIRAEYQTTSAE